jgi:PAS domain S-box-containing protein
MMSEFLHISGYTDIDHVSDIRSLWLQLKKDSCDIILLDYILPDGTGLDVLDQMTSRDLQIPVVMVTGQGNERIAVQAIQRGASDYLIKGGDYLVTLPALIRKTIQANQLKISVQRSLDQIRYQALLLNNVRDAVVVWDLKGCITFWNPAATALFGWTAEERLDRPVAQFYLQSFTPTITIPKEGDPIGHYVVRKYNNREGKTIYISSRVSALRDIENKNNLIGYMDVSHDISRRVEAEQALRESEARYRAIVEDYQTELICRFKPNGTLTFVNERYCHYFNRSRDELIGMNFLYFVPEGERPRIIQHLVSFEQEKPVATMEHQVVLPSQETHWLQRTDRAIFNERGRILEFQSVARDTTEKRNMEAQIQATQSHLIQAARMATIGEVASGVAHQIYNPLTTIIADAQILLRTLSPEQTGRDSAEAIEQAGWRLQQIVQRLMELSRPASETLNPLHVNETIQSASSLVSDHIEAIGCRLETDLGKDLPLIRGSLPQLESLWINLLLLARDASSDGRGHVIRIQSKNEPLDTVIVEVSDDGQPIPTELIHMIFEPSFAGTTIGRGTGMELSICREIVRQHGGQITAESITPEKNSGRRDTIFRVALPAEV